MTNYSECVDKINAALEEIPKEDRTGVLKMLISQYTQGKPIYVITPSGDTLVFKSLEVCRRYFVSEGYLSCSRSFLCKSLKRNHNKGGTVYGGYELFRLSDEEEKATAEEDEEFEEKAAILDRGQEDSL